MEDPNRSHGHEGHRERAVFQKAEGFSNQSIPAQPILAASPPFPCFIFCVPLAFATPRARSLFSVALALALATACHRNLFHSKDSIQAKRERDRIGRRRRRKIKTWIGIGVRNLLPCANGRNEKSEPIVGENRHVDSEEGGEALTGGISGGKGNVCARRRRKAAAQIDRKIER